MTAATPPFISFGWPAGIAFGAIILAASMAILGWRHVRLPRSAATLGALGMALISAALAEPSLRVSRPATVAVMIDVSPSTRGAAFHRPEALRARLDKLLAGRPCHLYLFSDQTRLFSQPSDGSATEMVDRADSTVFAPPTSVDAVVLFGDGRFELPASVAQPVYPVIDASLDDPADASVESLEWRGDDAGTLAAHVRVGPGEIALRALVAAGVLEAPTNSTGTASPATTSRGGASTVEWPRDPRARRASVSWAGGDAWPENDELSIVAPPDLRHPQRWWIGARDPGTAEWRHLAAADVPTDLADFLLPAVIVLDTVAADELSPVVQQSLTQYVRDLGGGLLILGGDRAFAAGGYPGTALDELSPLSSKPPRPTTHWIILVDASGSMASAPTASGPSRWQAATAALRQLIPLLPADDLVTVGSFARKPHWWARTEPARGLAGASIPSADLAPGGPTNLDLALHDVLRQFAESQHGGADAIASKPRRELLLITDADATIDRPDALVDALRAAGVRVHLLATAPVDAGNALRQVVDRSGGTFLSQPDPARWTSDLRRLQHAAVDKELDLEPRPVDFESSLQLPARTAAPTNRTWLKEAATVLATSGERILAASRRIGLGEVAAVAFAATAEEAVAFAARIAHRPRDPRFTVTWKTGRTVRVTVDAYGNSPATSLPAVNGLRIQLTLTDEASDESDPPRELKQTAPGLYESSFGAMRDSQLATLSLEGQVIDRAVIAGRYAPEFDAIGNDHANLRKLAALSGGRLVEAADQRPIEFPDRFSTHAIGNILAIAGAACVAAALVVWRLSD